MTSNTAIISAQSKMIKLKLTEYSDAYDDMEHEYNYHIPLVFITPQIGYNAGIIYECICKHPNEINIKNSNDNSINIKSVKRMWLTHWNIL